MIRRDPGTTRTMKYRIIHLVASLSLIPYLGAAVVQNDATIADKTPVGLPFPDGRYFFLTQTAPPGNGMFLYQVSTAIPNSFTFTYLGIAEANSLYLAVPGDQFDIVFVRTRPSFANNSNNPGSGILSLLPGETRYLAYWDDRFFAADDLFGWARLSNVGGEIRVEESATAVGGGIVVGTLTQIPEPSGFMMAATALAMAAMRRTRRSQPDPESC